MWVRAGGREGERWKDREQCTIHILMVLQHNASVILSGLTCTFTEEINEWNPVLAQKKRSLGEEY